MTNEFVTVATFEFLPEAEVTKLCLEQQGLTVVLFDAATISMGFSYAAGYIKLQVPSSQVQAAEEVLAQMRCERAMHEKHPEAGKTETCLACGLALPPESTRCPACGWSYTDEDGEPTR